MEVAKEQTNAQKFSSALKTYDEIIQLDPNDEGAYIMKGYVYMKMENPELAEKSFNRAISMNEKNPWGYVGLSNILQDKGNYIEGLKQIEKALKIKPNCESILISRGQLFQLVGEHDNAIEEFEKVLKINQRSLASINGLTSSYLGIRDHSKAEIYAKKAIEMNSKDCDALRNFAHLNYRINQKETSCRYANEALARCIGERDLKLIEEIQMVMCN